MISGGPAVSTSGAKRREKGLPWTRRMGVWGPARPPVPRARDLGGGG